MKKKFLILSIASMLTISAISCGGEKQDDTPKKTPKQEEYQKDAETPSTEENTNVEAETSLEGLEKYLYLLYS